MEESKKEIAEKSDAELVADYLVGHAASFDLLVSRHLKSVYNFVSRLTGARDEIPDIVQDVFLKVWKNIRKYDQKQNFKTWLFAIARNTSIDWLRKRRSLVFSELDNPHTDESFGETLVDLEPLPHEIFETRESKELANSLIASLPENQKTAVLLRIMEHLSFDEIAEITGKPMNTVKSYYQRAIISMRQKLADRYPKKGANAPK